MASSKTNYPPLSPELVEDPAALTLAIDAILRVDRHLRTHAALIADWQRDLRALVSEEAWTTYLCLDEQTTARLADALLILARYAFREGVRSAPWRRA
jgi:hypothetical protein